MNSQKNPNSIIVQKVPKDAGLEITFSPRKVAKSIGVSESSLKRWCDSGLIQAIKTAGGHRRISRSTIISFVKSRRLQLVDPESIGLPGIIDLAVKDADDAVRQVFEALLVPDEKQCERLLVFLYMEGWEFAEIFDQVVAPAFERIGSEWCNGSVEVFQERQACITCWNAVHKTRSILPAPSVSALTAIGGAIEHDQYLLPTQAVETTLISLGCRATSLGSNLPLATLLTAVQRERPDLLWISCSHLQSPDEAIVAINEFAKSIPDKTTLVIGGNALDANLRSRIKNAICADNLSQLAVIVRRLQQIPALPAEPSEE